MDAKNILFDEDIQLLKTKFQTQVRSFQVSSYPSYKQRIANLNHLYRLVVKYETQITEAISQDFGNRSKNETRLFEILPILSAIKYCKKNLKNWMKTDKREVSLMFQPGSSYVLYQPLGVIGIVVPWNYPLFLSLGPLIQVLAAGNRAMIKMSEYSPNFSNLLTGILAEAFTEDTVCVVNGDAQYAEQFTKLPFNHLVFTGATSVAKHVLHAAADNITPVTLELGGKSPVIVSKDCNLEDAAARVAFGKTVNAGQTCIAPDYVFVHESVKVEFLKHYQVAIRQFYPNELASNPDSTAIINQRQWARLKSYIDDATEKNAQVTNLKERVDPQKFSHFVVESVTDEMEVMKNEIFGPILPIMTFKQLSEVVSYINSHERPLALYFFGHNKADQDYILKSTHSGGVSINETLLHAGQDDMPFGGVGHSGMGHYHGHEGFLRFSHAKSVFVKSKLSVMRMVYPPYNRGVHKLIYKLFLK